MTFYLLLIPFGLLSAALFWSPWPLLLSCAGSAGLAVFLWRGSAAYFARPGHDRRSDPW